MSVKSQSSNIIGLVLVIASVVGYLFFVAPVRAEIGTLESEKQVSVAKKQNLENRLKNYQALKAELDQSSEVKSNQGLNAIPQKFDQDLLINSLIDKAEKNKMTIGALSFGRGAETELGVRAASVTASVEGDYQRLIGFLKDLESELERKLVIKNISVQLGDSLGPLQQVNFTLSMEVYFQEDF